MKLFLTSLFCFFSVVVAQADNAINLNQFKKNLQKVIVNSSAITNFWFGDDGVDCGKPQVRVLKIDFNGALTFFIQQSKNIHGCFYHTGYTCKTKFTTKKNGKITLKKVSLNKDCSY
ncbi:MAG: hypothetical protein HAW63_05775 [Bdellovibrionaceae bacterium]|nr:hypothetical protein [Pseudobdellovibrionaceae bacterium]